MSSSNSDADSEPEQSVEEEETEKGVDRVLPKSGTKPQQHHQHKKGEACKRTTKSSVKKALPLLNVLVSSTDEERDCILKHLNSDAVNILCCCVWNAIHNREVVPESAKKVIRQRLKDNRQHLHYIAKQSNNPIKRRRRLIQQGGSLPLLLSAVIPCIRSSYSKSKTE